MSGKSVWGKRRQRRVIAHLAPKRGERAVHQTTALDGRKAVEWLWPRLSLEAMDSHGAEGTVALLFEQARTTGRAASRR